MASGREVWGFPKQLAQFDFAPRPGNGGGARTFNVKGYVLNPFQPSTRASWVPLCEVKPDVPQSGGQNVVNSLGALAGVLLERLGNGFAGIAGALSTMLGTGNGTMAFLKQFPDAANPFKACYQGIIEAPTSVLTIRSAGLTDDTYQLRLLSYASLPFLEELGIAPDWQDVGRGIWVDFDFTLGLGTEIWRA
jgi:hypothetical protein